MSNAGGQLDEKLDKKQPLATPRKSLGRGLGSLLGERDPQSAVTEKTDLRKETPYGRNQLSQTQQTVQQVATAPVLNDEQRIFTVAIEQVEPCKGQPRKEFAIGPLNELAESIKEKGILQPIIARRQPNSPDTFEILAGERRWRAAQLAGLKKIPVILKKTNDQEALELALIENIQRENLNPIEEAEAYKHLIEEYDLTQQELAQRMGKDRATIANLIRLLNLKTEVRSLVRGQQLSLGHAKVLLAIDDSGLQGRLAQLAIKKQWSVRETERQVKKMKEAEGSIPSASVSSRAADQLAAKAIVEKLKSALGTQIDLSYNKGKGSIDIHFYTDEQFHQIIERLQTCK